MRLRNISPLGTVEVAWHGVIEAGEEFEVKAEHVAGLILQLEHFDTADDEAAQARAEASKPAVATESSAGADVPAESGDTPSGAHAANVSEVQ